MFVFDIGLPNGFTADVASEIDRNNMAKMVDVDEDSLNIYYDSVSGTEENIRLVAKSLEISSQTSIAGFNLFRKMRKGKDDIHLFNSTKIKHIRKF